MVIRDVIKKIEETLAAAGVENARFEAELMARFVFGMDPLTLVLSARDTADDALAQKVFSLAAERASGRPIQYILGTQEFMSLEFDVDPSVLIPRADTETLVECALEECRTRGGNVHVLDIGTGSGCIGISIARYAPSAVVDAVDISEAALDTARKNARKNGVYDRMTFAQCDILADEPCGKYDIIVSNPPYIRTDVVPTLEEQVRCHEPLGALEGGSDGLMFYRRIADIAPRVLNNGGALIFEIGFDQGSDVMSIMSRQFTDTKLIKDLCGNDRVVYGVLNE